jgi:hypothetical protein
MKESIYFVRSSAVLRGVLAGGGKMKPGEYSNYMPAKMFYEILNFPHHE